MHFCILSYSQTVNPRASLQHRYSLPTIEPQLPMTVMNNDQEHPLLARHDSDWRSSLNISSLRFSNIQSEKCDAFGVENDEASVKRNTKEKSPTTIKVTHVESPSDTELNIRLECLCLAVTEQALE